MTSPQGPAREERWHRVLLEGAGRPSLRAPDHKVYGLDFGPDIDWLAAYLTSLEGERDAYRQALEKIIDYDVEVKFEELPRWMMRVAAEALVLSSAGRDMQSRLPKIQPQSA